MEIQARSADLPSAVARYHDERHRAALQYSELRNIRLPCVRSFLGVRRVASSGGEKWTGCWTMAAAPSACMRAAPARAPSPCSCFAVGIGFAAAFLSLYVDLILCPHPGFERSCGMASLELVSGPIRSGIPYGNR